jgi:hypothetical protein
MQAIPTHTFILFGLATLGVLGLWLYMVRLQYKRQVRNVGLLLILYLSLQGWLGFEGFYEDGFTTRPPRFLMAVLPGLLLCIAMIATPFGRGFLSRAPLIIVTYLHVVRIPVELVIYSWFISGWVPREMTFAGRNPDILIGLLALPVGYLVFAKKKWPAWLGLGYHVLGMMFLLNIVAIAILSAQSPFQVFGLDQPNRAVLTGIWVWLPSFIVPGVLLAHLAALLQLLNPKAVGPV